VVVFRKAAVAMVVVVAAAAAAQATVAVAYMSSARWPHALWSFSST